MAEPSSPTIEHFFCHNSACVHPGKRGQGNVYFRGWSGRDKRIRMVYCRTCKKSYSERKGTARERSQLPPYKVVAVLGWRISASTLMLTGAVGGVVWRCLLAVP